MIVQNMQQEVQVYNPQNLFPKALLLKKLNKEIPNNKDYKMPEYFFRADMIPDSIDTMDIIERDEHLETAIVELDYDQGFPTLPNAEPFWSRLVCEPPEAFRAFTAYLDMPTPDVGPEQPVRQVHYLCTQLGMQVETLLSFAYMYYWPQRAQAYDAFMIASHAKLKENRLLAAEANHYELSTKFLAKATDALAGMMDDADADISMKELVDVIKYMTQLQRLSLGVAPFSVGLPKGAEGYGPNAGVKVIMQTIMQNGESESKVAVTQDHTKLLFENDDYLERAQSLILDTQDASAPRSKKQLTFENDSE